MSQSANAKDADPFLVRYRSFQGRINGRPGALKGCGMFTSQIFRNLMEECLLSNVVSAESAIVEVPLAEGNAFIAINVSARQAVLAMATSTPMEATSGTVSNFELGYERANRFHDSHSFVP